MIQIIDLCKTFDEVTPPVTALKNINLRVNRGDIFGVIGMSGAGKSTLLRCLSMLEEPTSGDILLNGRNTAHLKGRELIEARRSMGVVFQGYNMLMQKNVYENVAFPLTLSKTPKEEIERTVTRLLELVGLADKAKAYPAQLSGGQKQRVAIARALATNPQVLLCDEPTSALDSLTTRSILQLLRDINRELNVTILIITHEMSVVKALCNRVAVIDEQHIVESGNTQEIFDNPKSDITRLLLGYEVHV
ncbi:MAG: ATP-binding cassette domain-containing protein [Candidatus Fimivivens sp.]|nr:ATP-binding cassette domain-containing protein [Candidatus Fimivivens sp.]